MTPRHVTAEEIELRKTAKGGWTKDVLAEWGVPWPPPKGWKTVIIESGIPYRCGDN